MDAVSNESQDLQSTRVVIIGGGPGGYEAALVAKRFGAEVTVVERQGLGGSAVLTDVVPSKTLIATADFMARMDSAPELGIRAAGEVVEVVDDVEGVADLHHVDLQAVNSRVRSLAAAQSADIRARVEREGARVIDGTGRLDGPQRVMVRAAGAADDGPEESLEADVVLIATGSRPRELPEAKPDGERILTWTQLYKLDSMPEKLIVVGSGVTGAEFAGAYNALGGEVVLVSSRDRVLPGEDQDAAEVIEEVFKHRGMTVMSRSRAESAVRTADGVVVTLSDGRQVEGSHVLLAVGAVPNTAGLGLEEAGVRLGPGGHVVVDRVSRTSARGVYAAGDCTGVMPLASVAATQGRIAMAHALGDAVAPLNLVHVSANIFTAPEIATVGYTEEQLKAIGTAYVSSTLPLSRNPRAKMTGARIGFIKLYAHSVTGVILGGVVVAARASELIFPITLAISNRLTVDQMAETSTVYPSMSGSMAEVARLLHQHRS